MFIALDGIDGTGKSTQLRMLLEWLREIEQPCVTYRDPGTTRLGEALREILLKRTEIPIDSVAEAMIYMASRAELVNEIIRPALANQRHVVGDRYVLANVAYQGYGLELGRDLLWELGRMATSGVMPDLTIVLDLDLDLAFERRGVATDRLERRDRDFHDRVRQGFLTEASLDPEAIQVISAEASADVVHQHIRAIIASRGFVA